MGSSNRDAPEMDKVTPYLQDQIDHIMDHFDWERVLETMQALNWTWGREKTPGVPDMKQSARCYLRIVANDAEARLAGTTEKDNPFWPYITFVTGSGGFMARWEGGILSLSFEVTEWDGLCILSEKGLLS